MAASKSILLVRVRCRLDQDKADMGVTVTPDEAEALQEVLGTCANIPHLTITQADASSSPAGSTATPTVDRTYASCDEAEEAGEQRIQVID